MTLSWSTLQKSASFSFTLFDNDPSVLRQDFVRIQQLLGQFALNVNPSKTYYDNKVGNVQETLSALRQSLIEIVNEITTIHTASDVQFIEVEKEVEGSLNARSRAASSPAKNWLRFPCCRAASKP